MKRVTVVLPFSGGDGHPESVTFAATGWHTADGVLSLARDGEPVAEFKSSGWLAVHDTDAPEPAFAGESSKRTIDLAGTTPQQAVAAIISNVLEQSRLFSGPIDAHEHSDGWHVLVEDARYPLAVTIQPIGPGFAETDEPGTGTTVGGAAPEEGRGEGSRA